MDEDTKWVYAGAGCFAGGLVAAALTQRPFWFAAGALIGAGIVGARAYENSQGRGGRAATRDPQALTSAVQERRIFAARPEWREQLGAPEIPAEETPAVCAGGEPLSDYDGKGLAAAAYPMMNRVPDVEITIDPMDLFVGPHFTGPFGPENDPVRHWGGGGSGVTSGAPQGPG